MRVERPPIDKAVALVVRAVGGRRELLVFRHPVAGVQIPKGTVEPGEELSRAALRELQEESGLALDCQPLQFALWNRRTDDGAVHRWHLYLMEAPAGLPEQWRHVATGSAEEHGLAFDYFWVPLDAVSSTYVDPLFAPTVELLRAHLDGPD